MKRVFTLLLLVITTGLTSNAQSETDVINFIEGLIRTMQPDGQIVYTDKLSTGELYKIKLKLKSNYITSISGPANENSISLSRKESIYLKEQLDLLINPYWNENLFSNSQLIKDEDLLLYFKNTYQAYSETLSDPTNSQSDKNNLMKNYRQPTVFKFSAPIYLRDNSICLLYLKYVCGNPCGTEDLSFYKKENGKWTKWIVVTAETF